MRPALYPLGSSLERFPFALNQPTSWPGLSRPSTPCFVAKTWMPATSAGMTPEIGATHVIHLIGPSLNQFVTHLTSSSSRVQCASFADKCLRLRAALAGGSSDHLVPASRAPARVSLLPPLREAERRNGADNMGHLCEGAPPALARAGAPSGAPPRRFFTRPPHFLAWTGGLHLTLSGQHWRCRSSRPVKPLKAAPSSGAGGDRASWDGIANLVCRRRHPRSATERLRKAPSVNGDGVHHM
jgi:hypothetical protein